MSKNIKEQIVHLIDIENNTILDKDGNTKPFEPKNAYLLPQEDGTHERWVTDDNGVISKQAGSGGSSNEIDPIFSASPSATITNSDISNWNSKLSAEIDTLESVVNRGNYSPKYITFTGTTTAPTRDGAIGMNTATYSMYFGNMNSAHTGSYNMGFGYGSLQAIQYGSENTVFGHYSFNKLTGLESESKWNVGIGNVVAFNLTKSTSNVFIGSLVGKNLSENVTEADLSAISPAASTHMKLLSAQSGYNATTKTFNTSLNTFVGFGINQATTTPTRAAMSTIIGASSLDYNRYRNYNNIVIGAGNYMTVANATMYNSIVIGNSVNLPNQIDVLAIGMNRNSRINSQDAIIYGLLPNTQLTFNAPITVPSTYMRNAQGDSTYTKQLVAKPNGDIGWENKVSIPNKRPSMKRFVTDNDSITDSSGDFVSVFTEGNITYNVDHTDTYGSYLIFVEGNNAGVTYIKNNSKNILFTETPGSRILISPSTPIALVSKGTYIVAVYQSYLWINRIS